MRNICFFLFFAAQITFAQTPYPLSFFWTGQIEGESAFEMRVNMYESDRLLSGKGSKIKGECLYWADSSLLKVEGEIKDNQLSFNCFDSGGKMVHSFQFPDAEGLQTTQNGRWTDGKKIKNCFLKTSKTEKLSKSMLTGFCVAINQRRNDLIIEDSVFATSINYLPKILYLPYGEGYRLDAKVFLRSDYYGDDFLEFADTITFMGKTTIRKISWQLIETKNTADILEIRQTIENNLINNYNVSRFQFIGGRWQKKDSNMKPDTSPAQLFISPEKIIYFSEYGIYKAIYYK